MDITVNESEPEGSIDRYAMDTTCTGEEVLHIPPHWHKVSVVNERGETTTSPVMSHLSRC